MSAQEMFEELGLKKQAHIPFKDWIVYGEYLTGSVEFDTTFKCCTLNMNITNNLLKAINKQFEELGWLDE